ncbi:hypothetical protein LX36DRAFT_317137 [Colletotrichum falcatum]|nr:hypothetical protein LX36DRAFT_317137 [Colletotrichum falcatum]
MRVCTHTSGPMRYDASSIEQRKTLAFSVWTKHTRQLFLIAKTTPPAFTREQNAVTSGQIRWHRRRRPRVRVLSAPGAEPPGRGGGGGGGGPRTVSGWDGEGPVGKSDAGSTGRSGDETRRPQQARDPKLSWIGPLGIEGSPARRNGLI